MDTIKTISEKWNTVPKVWGLCNEVTLPNGKTVSGRYVLCPSGAATPSHNSLICFLKNEGFPVDGNGQSANVRDYEHDMDAQDIIRNIAAHYDSRALQLPVIVSRDGVVLSGNERTMAGELAAINGTDSAYIKYLYKFPQQFGFTPGQVRMFNHPRILFLLDRALPYNAATFAMFYAQEMKGQSYLEQASAESIHQNGDACGSNSGDGRKKSKWKKVEAIPQEEEIDVDAILAEYSKYDFDDGEEEKKEEKEPEQETVSSVLKQRYPYFWRFILILFITTILLNWYFTSCTDLNFSGRQTLTMIFAGVLGGLYKGFFVKENKNVTTEDSGCTLEKIMGALCGFFIIKSLKDKD